MLALGDRDRSQASRASGDDATAARHSRRDASGNRLMLHVFPTYDVGGTQVRVTDIINHFGDKYRHAIIALDGNLACKTRLDGRVAVEYPAIDCAKGRLVGNVRRIAGALRQLGPDLLVTYNWGAIEWAFANTLAPVCPHLHMEDGFGAEEADRQLDRRVLFRRIALLRTARVIVPSRSLLAIATRVWRLPPNKLAYIPNGVDWERFAASRDAAKQSEVGRLVKSSGEMLIGTVAPLRAEKNLGFLLRAFAAIADRRAARLVIVGDGPERARLATLAQELRVAHAVDFAGHVNAVEEFLGVFDIFALTSRTEQMPNSILQAMAARLPVAAVDVGDVRRMLSSANKDFVVPKDDERAFVKMLERLLGDAQARTRLGRENQARVRECYDQKEMFRAYGTMFDSTF